MAIPFGEIVEGEISRIIEESAGIESISAGNESFNGFRALTAQARAQGEPVGTRPPGNVGSGSRAK